LRLDRLGDVAGQLACAAKRRGDPLDLEFAGGNLAGGPS
jgi:hypothetical protein